MSQLILNRAKCLKCGDVIESVHVHDFVTCSCLNLSVDGGLAYAKRSFGDINSFEEMSIYDDQPFEIIRQHIKRGGRGKNGDQPLKWVPLCEMSNEWLNNVIAYVNPNNPWLPYYKQEQKYRLDNTIYIEDESN